MGLLIKKLRKSKCYHIFNFKVEAIQGTDENMVGIAGQNKGIHFFNYPNGKENPLEKGGKGLLFYK